MKKLIPATLAVAAFLAMTPAFAEEAAVTTETTVEATTPAADATVTTEVKTEVAAPVEYTLVDGTTKVSVEGDHVFVVAADGAKTAAPDGDHATTTEGVTLKVKDGLLVKEEAAATTEAPAAEEAPKEAPAE
jgi:hypothetical protein